MVKTVNIRLRKILFRILLVLVSIVLIIIIFISPIAKYVIEKYDVDYTGREITMGMPYINPFTGYIYLRNLNIYEAKSDSLFFYAQSVSVNFEMSKLFSKTYEISDLTLSNPIITIIQHKKAFNFDDLISKFSKKGTIRKEPKDKLHFNLLNVKIKDGICYYRETSIPVSYYVKKVNIETQGKRWNQDTLLIDYALESGIGTGNIKGTINIHLSSLDYKLAAIINKFDLSVMEQYIRDVSNYGKFRANLDADIKASGNFKRGENLNAKGIVSINDLHFGKDTLEDYLAFQKLTVDIKQLNPKEKKYVFDSISLVKPYFKYERYDHLDNLQNMFGKKGQIVKEAKADNQQVNILFKMADYVKILAKNFFKSNYKLSRLAIYKADIRYNDYTLNEKFSVAAYPLTILADSIERSLKWVNLSLKTGLKPYGEANFNLSINPKDSSDFNLNYHLQKLPVSMFNPYFITYTSFPLDRGIIELQGNWVVRKGYVNSNNHFILIDPLVGKKQKRNGAKWIPLKLIMFFVRERGNVVDYEIPIKGNLKDPKFKFKDVILDILTNIFVKPATISYRTEVKMVENTIEKSLTVTWEMRKSDLLPNQEEFVEKIVDFMKRNPDVFITVNPLLYTEKEKEYILFFEAKKQFYLSTTGKTLHSLSQEDTISIEKISVKDPLFVNYLNKKAGRELLFTVQDKCKQLIKNNTINSKLSQLNKERKKTFMSYFERESIANRVILKPITSRIPFNGFSLYKINYKGDIPQELLEAFEKINDFNNFKPRKKYKELREKNRKAMRGK